MIKFLLKFGFVVVLLVAVGLVGADARAAAAARCPTSFQDAQNNLNWGVTPTYNGVHGGNMAGMIVHAYDAKTNQNIDVRYRLHSGISINDPNYAIINGHQTNLNDRIFMDINGDFSNRVNEFPSQTNSALADTGGGVVNAVQCRGWDAFAPVDVDGPNEVVGNGYVLDCGTQQQPTHFWISDISDPPLNGPNQGNGYWTVQIVSPNQTVNINPYTEGDNGFSRNHFTVSNGSNTFVNMIWHAQDDNKPIESAACHSATIADQKLGATGHHSYTRVWISGTNNDQSNYHIGWGESHTFGFDPVKQTITIHVERYYNNTPGPPYEQYTKNIPCYHARCSIEIVADGSAPSNIVQAGHQFTANVSVTNDGQDTAYETIPAGVGGYRFSMTGTEGRHDTNFDLDPGQKKTLPVTLTAPNSVQNYSINFYPDYWGSGSIGDGCTANVPVYQHFILEPHSSLTYNSAEDPGTIGYEAHVHNNSGNAVAAPATSTFTVAPFGGGSRCAGAFTVTSGPYGPNGDTTTMGPGSCNPSSVVAGDQYCTNIVLNYNAGYVGPGGTVAGTGVDPSSPTSDKHCFTVTNKPYFKAYNGGVSAGGDFKQSDGTCSSADGGILAGWNNNSGGVDRGAGSQLSALAMIKITGFASAQTSITRSPTDLSFANTVSGDISSSADSPSLGGNYNPGGSRCLTDVTPPAGTAAKPDGYVQPGTAGISGNQSVFVNGDVYISGNITYANSWATDSPPSFVLRATGNIYIDPGVTRLDGLYISKNKIYTCSVNSGGGNFAPVARQNIYNTCKNQLVVFGNFVAKKINLLRSYGSLRDEKPVGGTAAVPAQAGANAPLYYTSSGAVAGDKAPCANIQPNKRDRDWRDNYLCPATGDSVTKLGFTKDGNTDTLKNKGLTNCTDDWSNVLRGAGYSNADDWNEVVLCSNLPINFGTNGIAAGKVCTRITEPSAAGFPAVYVCVSTGTPGSPAVPPSPPAVLNCSNRGVRVVTNTCAGEVFFLNPSLYYAKPAIQLPSGGATQYDSITSLPPVL